MGTFTYSDVYHPTGPPYRGNRAIPLPTKPAGNRTNPPQPREAFQQLE